MFRDAHGLALSAANAEAAAAYDRAVHAYLKYRTDGAQHVADALAADPGFAMAHVLKGCFAMLSYKQANVAAAADAERAARGCMAGTTRREQDHVEALAAWIAGDLDRMLDIWEGVFERDPTDIVAFRLHHFNAFWLGRPDRMLEAVERTLPRWDRSLPGWPTMLACRCFAREECGDYTVAEAAGRAAIELDPADLWAAHAVAHVLEMQGRRREGVAWLVGLEANWEGGNNLKHHLWWHRAMFHLELHETDAALDLYDRRFRDLASPLVKAQPDLYIDVQNAASMLFRLERLGVDVGGRWTELADKAEARIGDCLSAFTLPHWMMALAATGRHKAAERLLEAMRAFGRGNGTVAPIVRKYALPVSEAILKLRRGEFDAALDAMRPALGGMTSLGGSHAQQDVLEQAFLDAALSAGSEHDVQMILERVAGRWTVPPRRRVGWAMAGARHESAAAPQA